MTGVYAYILDFSPKNLTMLNMIHTICNSRLVYRDVECVILWTARSKLVLPDLLSPRLALLPSVTVGVLSCVLHSLFTELGLILLPNSSLLHAT